MWNIIVGSAIAAIGTISTVALGWAMQINTKVNVNEATQKVRNDDLKELINEKFDGVDDKFASMADRLARIERAMNGRLAGH